MSNNNTIGSGAGSTGAAIATGQTDFAPLAPNENVTGVATGGVVGLPQGNYGTESVMNPAMAINGPLSTPNALPPPPPSMGLTAAVGDGKPNHYADVLAVQERLKALGYPVDPDGQWGPQSRWALQLFSAVTSGLESVYLAVGSIGPGSFLDAKLADVNSAIWQKLAKEGTGWVNVDTDGYSYATGDSLKVIDRAGARYAEGYQTENEGAPRLMINDISRRDGSVLRRYGKDEHETHRTGLDIDLRLPRKAGYGNQTGTKTNWGSYDRDATYAMVDAFASDDRVERVILHDATIKDWAKRDKKPWLKKLHSNDASHRDHLHVDVKPAWEK